MTPLAAVTAPGGVAEAALLQRHAAFVAGLDCHSQAKWLRLNRDTSAQPMTRLSWQSCSRRRGPGCMPARRCCRSRTARLAAGRSGSLWWRARRR
jgi:hypothetical protein